jgi:hypothetical protein
MWQLFFQNVQMPLRTLGTRVKHFREIQLAFFFSKLGFLFEIVHLLTNFFSFFGVVCHDASMRTGRFSGKLLAKKPWR